VEKRCDGSIDYGNGDHGPDCEDGSDEDIKVCCSGNNMKYTMDVGKSLKISCVTGD